MPETSNITTSRWFWIGLVLAVVAAAGGAGADILCVETTGLKTCV